MRTLITLIWREYWEHRGSFLVIPAIIGVLLFFVALCASLAIMLGLNIVYLSGTIHVNQPAGLTPLAFYGIGVPFVLALWCVIAHYFLGAFFDDRKDKSVLFWQSMPISQTQLILSKLIAGLILAPLLTMICIVITSFLLLVLATLVFAQQHIEYWPVLWRPMPILLTWWGQLLALLQQSIWIFPFAAWFLLCSAFSRRAPLLRAVIPMLIILVIEGFFSPQPYFWHFIEDLGLHILGVWANVMVLLQEYFSDEPVSMQHSLLSQWGDPNLFLGVVLGIVFVVIAGWLRRRCYDQ